VARARVVRHDVPAAGSGGDIRPIPDPTALTSAAVEQATEVAKDYTDGRIAVLLQRLDGIDRATELLNQTVTRVPTETQKEVGHLNGLMEVRFGSVQVQFAERDTRQERESRDNKIAVDAAFAAQKEIAAKQDESNARALEKSEKGTEKTIDGLAGKIDDLKERLVSIEARVVAIESGRLAVRASTQETGTARAGTLQLVAVSVAVGVLLLGIYAATGR
jgi:hypothetical protein